MWTASRQAAQEKSDLNHVSYTGCQKIAAQIACLAANLEHINSSMALQLIFQPWRLLQFRNPFHTVGMTLGRAICPLQGDINTE
jgi:hypothetical protein